MLLMLHSSSLLVHSLLITSLDLVSRFLKPVMNPNDVDSTLYGCLLWMRLPDEDQSNVAVIEYLCKIKLSGSDCL